MTRTAATGAWRIARCLLALGALAFAPALLAQPAVLTLALTNNNGSPVVGGPVFTYTATLANPQSAVPVGNVTLTLPLPPNVLFHGATINSGAFHCVGPPSGTSGTLVCKAATFASSTTVTLAMVASVAAETASGMRTATARLQSNTALVTASSQQSLLVSAPLTLALATRPVAVAGDVLHYQLTIDNGGPSSAINPTATLNLPAGTRFLALYGTRGLRDHCSANGGGTQVTCAARALASGQHHLVVLAQTFATTPPGTLSATATLTPGTGSVAGSPASASTQLLAARVTTTTAVAPSVPSVAENNAVTLSALVTGQSPTGTVAFRLLNQALPGCGAVPLAGGGNTRAAFCVTPLLADGVYTFTGSYAGDTVNAPSAGSAQVTVTPVSGFACSGFTDVDSASPFCPNVEWLRNRSVTLGCAASAYCPGDAVTRLAMAAFMNRLGTALTSVPVHVVANPGALDPDAAPIVCASGPLAAPGFARSVTLDGVFAGEGVGTADVWVEIVSSPDGIAWLPVAPGARISVATGRAANVRVTGSYDHGVGESARFALRITRAGGTANLSGSACRLRASVGNRNATFSPYDEP